VEFLLLKRGLAARIGAEAPRGRYPMLLWGSAISAGLVGWLVLTLAGQTLGPVLRAVAVLLPFGLIYLLLAAAAGEPLARRMIGRAGPRP
jgi:hypothetical protein